MRFAPPLLRFSCGAGPSGLFLGLVLVLVSALVFLGSSGEVRADGGALASPDDMTLDLGGVTLETRRVPHGSFTQGAPASEVGHDKEEEPAHHVTITKDFWIGKFPVTRGQFAKFVADTRYVSDAEKGQAGGAGWAGAMVPDGGKGPVLVQKKEFTWRAPGFTQTDEHPVVLVSYGDANAFVGWASRKTGKRVRLPTESEWEFASRAGTTTSWSGGGPAESDPGSYGWFKPNAGNGTRPVGQKKPNPLGLFDMSGNVMEWCRDVYAPYREGALIDPEVATNTGTDPERRVLRGGSWFRDPKRGRSAARYKNTPGSRNADNGFRVVVTNEEMVTPGVTGPGPDFVPASPLGAAALPGPGVQGGASSSSGGGSSGPLADGEPLRTEPVGHPGDAFSWGLLLASPVAGASAAVAWMLLRRKKTRRSTKAAPNAVGVSTRAAADGFFVSVPGAAAGTRVRLECIVGGRQVADVVSLGVGKETFVHTGSAPTAIRILGILAGTSSAEGADRTADRPPVAPRVPPPPPSSSAGVERRPSRAPPLPAAARRKVTNVTDVTTQPMHPPHTESPRVPYAESQSVIVAPSPSPGVVEGVTVAREQTSSESAAAAAAAATSEAMAAAETLSTSAMTSADAIAAVSPITPPNDGASTDERADVSAQVSAEGEGVALAKEAATAPAPEVPDAPVTAEVDPPAKEAAESTKEDIDAPLKADAEDIDAPSKADADAPAKEDIDAPLEADADAPAKAEDIDAPSEADADAPAEAEDIDAPSEADVAPAKANAVEPTNAEAAAPLNADAETPAKDSADVPAKPEAAAPSNADAEAPANDAEAPAKGAAADGPTKEDAEAPAKDAAAPSEADADDVSTTEATDAPLNADADAPANPDADARAKEATNAPLKPDADAPASGDAPARRETPPETASE